MSFQSDGVSFVQRNNDLLDRIVGLTPSSFNGHDAFVGTVTLWSGFLYRALCWPRMRLTPAWRSKTERKTPAFQMTLI